MLHPRIVLALLPVVACIFWACHKSTGPASPTVVAYQVPGCVSQLGKSGLSDSCFSYQFHEALAVDFCATGNCCPDSNRFSLNHKISSDSIIVTVADTAAHLCHCICSYVLHVEFHDLPGNSYLLICERSDYPAHTVLYAEEVHRQ